MLGKSLEEVGKILRNEQERVRQIKELEDFYFWGFLITPFIIGYFIKYRKNYEDIDEVEKITGALFIWWIIGFPFYIYGAIEILHILFLLFFGLPAFFFGLPQVLSQLSGD